MLRLVLTCLFVWLATCSVSAQPRLVANSSRAEIDSIQRVLTDTPRGDTMHVIRLHALARLCFAGLQFKRGLLAAMQARKLAKQLRYDNGEGLYWQTLAAFSYTNSLWFYYDFQYSLAAGKQQQAPPFRNSINTRLNHPIFLDYAAAIRQLEDALRYFSTERNAEMMAVILSFISANYRYLYEPDKSLAYLDRAIQAFRQAHQPVAYYYLLAYKARLLRAPEQYSEAERIEGVINQFLSRHSNSPEAALITYQLSWYYVTRNQLVQAYKVSSEANATLERVNEEHLRPFVLENLGYIYIALKTPKKALLYFKQAALLLEKTSNQSRLSWMYNKIAFTLIALNRFDEAQRYAIAAKRIHDTNPGSLQPNVDLAKYYDATGQILMGLGRYQQALPNFIKALEIDRMPGGNGLSYYFNYYVARCYQKLGNLPASVVYGTQSYQKAMLDNSSDGWDITLQSSQLLFDNYERLAQPATAYQYLKTYYTFRKAIDDQNVANRLTEFDIQSIIRKGEQEKARLQRLHLLKEQQNQNQRRWLFGSLAALLTVSVLLGLLYRSNKHKQRANRLLNRQNQEIEHQRTKAEQALADLKATQAQLVQQEKLASLGELTAGIAHEIQNPLNFVNNYSALSAELAQQLSHKVVSINADEPGDNRLIGTLIKNLQKINYHGERASSVVRNMLALARTNTSEYRPTNLNALVEEYSQLAFHAQRAKEPTFTCQLITELDPSIGPINIAPQEIGQVVLNLLANAFYAVQQRWAGQLVPPGTTPYNHTASQPCVRVSTHQLDEQVEVRVSDNGTGIPCEQRDKLFQPFYTTKPVGEGTGLGLSLSHDIVVKGHRGSLTVESQEGVGTTVSFCLPTIRLIMS